MFDAYLFLCPYTQYFEQNRMALRLALLVSSVGFQIGFVYFLLLRIFRSSSWHFLYVGPVQPSTRFLMIVTDHERYLNLHGEQAARLNQHQSTHRKRHRSPFIKIMSPFLFYEPESHLRKLVMNSIVNQSSWFQYLQNLTDEWKELTVYVHITFLTHQCDRRLLMRWVAGIPVIEC